MIGLQELGREFLASSFMPHGHCYRWIPELVTLHAVSDTMIAAAYFAIPLSLVQFIARRRDVEFRWMFGLFGTFIFLCGMTHVAEVWSIWNGTYWATGTLKLATGIVSAATAVMLIPLVPKALALPSPEALRRAYEELKQEVEARRRAEEELRLMNEELEARVSSRTRELQLALERLQLEAAERAKAQVATLLEAEHLRETEAALRELNATLEARVADRTDELNRRNQELQSFAFLASHDLQEPLRKVQTFADLIQSEYASQVPDEVRSYLTRIMDAGARMSLLLTDLLDYSRVVGRPGTFERLKLSDVAGEVMRDIEMLVEKSGAEIEIDADVDVDADRGQMRQLLNHLVLNAIKFQEAGSTPHVRIHAYEADGDTCQIEVIDNGVGFDERYAVRIFKPFERLHGRTHFPGTGMGLAICARIVERHGGTITASSTPGEGSRFVVTLPIRQQGDDVLQG